MRGSEGRIQLWAGHIGELALKIIVGASLVFQGLSPANASSPRLTQILRRGELVCGLPHNVPGFAVLDEYGGATGFDADLCRIVAKEILGKPEAVRFVQVDSIDRFLESKSVDLVFHGLTSNLEREVRWHIAFGPVTFVDGQAFAVRLPTVAKFGDRAANMRGPICIENSSRHLARLRAWLDRNRSDSAVLVFQSREEARNALRSGECVAWSADASVLGSTLAGSDARSFLILSERLSVEPLAPILRRGDTNLLDAVERALASLKAPLRQGTNVTRYDDMYSRHFGGTNWPEHLDQGLSQYRLQSPRGVAPNF